MITDADLEKLIGPVSMRDFLDKATEQEQANIRRWAPTLAAMSDTDFFETCVNTIADGAIAESQRSPAEEPYIKARACMGEARRRHENAGHGSSCRGDNIYDKALDHAMRSYGLGGSEPRSCTCGHDQKG